MHSGTFYTHEHFKRENLARLTFVQTYKYFFLCGDWCTVSDIKKKKLEEKCKITVWILASLFLWDIYISISVSIYIYIFIDLRWTINVKKADVVIHLCTFLYLLKSLFKMESTKAVCDTWISVVCSGGSFIIMLKCFLKLCLLECLYF